MQVKLTLENRRASTGPAVFLLTALVPIASMAADSALGRWRGTYQCNQMTAAVEVDIWSDRGTSGGMRGIFMFGPNYPGHSVPNGSYFVTVVQGVRDVALVPDVWLSRPNGFEMAGAKVFFAQGDLKGYIDNAACAVTANGIHLKYAGESNHVDAPRGDTHAAPRVAGSGRTDYMQLWRDASKRQNRENCERAAKGANIRCTRD